MVFQLVYKKTIIFLTFIVLFIALCLPLKIHANDIRILAPRAKIDPVFDYFVELTRLVLSKNEHLYPKRKLVFVAHDDVTQGRSLMLLEHNYVDIVWSGTNARRELRYSPIRIPLFRGLLGYRVLLILKEDKEKFLQIKTPAQLKKLNACQGAHWPDSDILEANGYLVSRVVHFNAMFKMLAKKRCDYFPRAIFEGYAEQKIAMETQPNIILMDELILHYNFPFYYFVEKNNSRLAERLENGLMAALADGSLMNLMRTHSVSKHLFPLEQWKDKRYFELSNDILGSDLSLENQQFWLNLKTQ
ncbi:hypothetical protein CXF85_05475 [Colwellia sp. 75C3]|uniref:hypothetical protein n=1 Tax=Colwellia sp. 75C3 TaxID=888425 RepID=UPI000C340257|nr:hypothetical protein [Colwellia sp. 75C3]PKG85058.1 hypothetical protein CXF85_05475 [Colwellia sp. 75C3]